MTKRFCESCNKGKKRVFTKYARKHCEGAAEMDLELEKVKKQCILSLAFSRSKKIHINVDSIAGKVVWLRDCLSVPLLSVSRSREVFDCIDIIKAHEFGTS